MSTSAVSYRPSSDQVSQPSEQNRGFEEQYVLRSSRSEGFPQPETFNFHRARKTSTTPSDRPKQKIRTKRRMRGFLIEFQNNEARVAFVENGETILYDLPAEQFRKAGIKVRNQPFQMDEVEIEMGPGAIVVGYQITALATASDAYLQTLSFDEER